MFACVPCFLALTDFGAFLFAWVVQRVYLAITAEALQKIHRLWSLPHLRWWLTTQIPLSSRSASKSVTWHAAHEYLL